MKKKKLLKRIEDLETMYKELLFEDDVLTRLELKYKYIQREKHEQLLLKGFSSGIVDLNSNKYCKECEYPILRLDKLATVLKNGQRVFRYEK